MKILNRRRYPEYIAAYSGAITGLDSWWTATQRDTWESFADVRRTFNSADIVGDRVVFNISGNRYRLVAWINYRQGYVVMKWFGTHEEYDKGEWK